MAKTNVVRLGLIAGGGAVAVVAIVAGVFCFEYSGITKDIALGIEIPGLTDSPAVERVAWPQLKEGRTAELEVPPTLDEIDELLAGRRNSLIAGGGGELEMDLFQEQAELDMTIPLFIPEETPLDRQKCFDRRAEFVRYVFDAEIARQSDATRSQFGDCLKLLTKRIAERNRELHPEDEQVLKGLAESDVGIVMLADVIFRRDEYEAKDLRKRCRDAVFACRDQDASAYVTFLAAHELLFCILEDGKRFNETDLALFFNASSAFLRELPNYVEAVGTAFPVMLCTEYLSGYFSDLDNLTRQWYLRTLGAAVAGSEEVSAYAIFCMLARHHNDVGWKARGGGWARDVPQSAWPIYERELNLASEYYQAAYSLHGDIPRAPCALINLAKSHDVGGTAKLWFNRCVATQRDYSKAYDNYSWTLSPRWGGSNYHQMEFANVCIAANDFGPGGISWEAVQPMRTARNSRSVLDIELSGIAGYKETLLRFADGVIAAYDAGVRDDCNFSGMRNLLDWLQDDQEWERFRRLLSFGQPDYTWTYADWIRGLGASYGTRCEVEVLELYKALRHWDRPVLDKSEIGRLSELVSEARSKAAESPEIQRLLDLAETNIDVARMYYEGEWVGISFQEDVRPGAVEIVGTRELDDEGAFRFVGRDSGTYPKLTLLPRLPAPMLIDCEVDPDFNRDKPFGEPYGIVAGSETWTNGKYSGIARAAWVSNRGNMMGYLNLPMPSNESLMPNVVTVPFRLWYRLGLLVTPTESRAYWHSKEVHREDRVFEEPWVEVKIGPMLWFNKARQFGARNLRIRYCPDGKPPADYDPALDPIHEQSEEQAEVE